MRIVGLDIGSDNAVFCCLSESPPSLKKYFDLHRREFPKVFANREGVRILLLLEPDIVVMEPTGIHYAEFWYQVLIKSGVEVRWVGHVQVKNFRKSHRLPSKNDAADALGMAAYGWQHLEEPEFFLKIQIKSMSELRRFCLQLQHINRIENPIMNCARQYLSHEFPEAAKIDSKEAEDGALPLWAWLAQERRSPHYDRLWAKSVARDFEIEISDFTRIAARRICDLERQQRQTEAQIKEVLRSPEFDTYNRVFDYFGFGLRTRAILLSHVYPFSNFLAETGQPLIDIEINELGKPQRRDRSLRAFKLRLGMGLVEDSSGKSQKWIPGGSDICRKTLWQWVLTKIEPRASRGRVPVGAELGLYIDGLKAGGVPGKVAQSRCAAKAVTLLYRALLRTIP